MTDELIHLDTSAVEVRDYEKREVFGRIIPYGERISVRGRPESFAPGALSDIDSSATRLFDHHERAVGKLVELEERQDGAYATFRVSKTSRGDELLELAKDGVLAFSPGFVPDVQTSDGVHRRIRALPEVSLVSMPAYGGARVLAVRDNKEADMPEDKPEAQGVDLAPIETRMNELSAQIEKLTAEVSAPGVDTREVSAPSPLLWFQAQVEGLVGKSHEKREKFEEQWEAYEKRALSDITGGETQAGDNTPADDLSGLVVEEFMSDQLVNILDRRRPLFAHMGRLRMPRSGYAKIPTITQHVKVAARAGQKEEANSRAMISKNATFEANWLDGAVDIALEVVAQADVDVLDLVWNDLLAAYAQATEHDASVGVVPLTEAGGHGFTYTGSPLLDGSPTYSEFINAVETQVFNIEDATGLPPNRLAVTRTQWATLIGMVDQDGRRIFSTVNPSNADARADLVQREITLPGGIVVFPVKNLTQAVLFNTESLKAADSGPMRVEATNVTLMGRDLGLIGRTMYVPRIPSGVVVYGSDPVS